MRNAWTRRDVALLAIAAGSLVGVKSTGLLSLGVLGLAFSVAGISRYWCAHRTIGLRPRHLTLLLWAAPLALLCGGLWLIRSWYVFGSPVSPLGVTLLGHQIFPGASREQLAYTMSVLADMRDIPAYAPLKQLVFYARRWLGPSFPWLTLGLLAPLAESHVRAVRRKPALSGALCAQWLGVVLVGVIGLPHLIALAGAPWSSLEEWEGLTLRYVTPLIMLYGIFCLTGVLWREADWPLPVRCGLPATWDVAGAFLAVGVVCYWALTKTGPSAEWAFMVFRIETAMTALLIGAALIQHRRRSPTHWRSYIVVGWLLLFISVLGAIALPNQAWLVRRAETEREAEYAVFLDVGRSGNAYRDGLYVALAHEAATGLDGNRRRFFTVGRFLWPLQLQTSEFNTLVLQLDLGRPSLLPLSDRPGAGSCDYVIVAPDVAGAVEGGHLDRFLYPGCTPVLIGSSAGFQIYHVE